MPSILKNFLKSRNLLQVVLAATNASNGATEQTIHPFSSTSMLDILAEFSQISSVRVIVGYILMVSSPHVDRYYSNTLMIVMYVIDASFHPRR